MSEQTIPITVLSGILGAGKTTTVNHLLSTAADRDIGVLVNDMGEVNVDADLVAESSDISEEDEELIELSNGCICCELRGDLLEAIDRLTSEKKFDAVVVESTGVAEPLPVAQTLTLGFDGIEDMDSTDFHEETGVEPLEHCYLDTTVTVVDAHQFSDAMSSNAVLDDDGTDKHLGDLLVEQVEFCDVLVLNKCDLVDDEELDKIESLLETLQPRAEIVRTTHGKVNPDLLVDTELFDFEEASQSAGWMKELREPHESAEEEHGVTSFVFESDRPFHPSRFATFLDEFPDRVVRSKGHVWLAGRDDRAIELHVAGQSIRIAPGVQWVASLPLEEQQRVFEKYPELKEEWEEPYGDRHTRLVLIGASIDHDEIRTDLHKCVLDDEEMNSNWSTLDDPLPEFNIPEGDENTDSDSDDESTEVGIAE
ncbi:GTP-binding protein [Salinarchaeum sp. IM2453]|uniref:GTP-binding protein n=1 Tax=Salinarchaeum sp. IM2453 TaxID=2862870 RepID=UPI001C83D157|nr:GTP-binding protein [Salinarchaeum sp. IM2453]QZA88239.1 GTP-binding protein [Salinarchaeum sp. IM2453]